MKKRRLEEELELPSPADSEIVISGDGEIFVGDCLGVIRYEDDRVTVRLRHGCLDVAGRGFTLRSFRSRRLMIRGEIKHIEFG